MRKTEPTRSAKDESVLQLPLPSRNLQRLDGVQMLRAVAVFTVAWVHSGQLLPLLGNSTRLPSVGISGVDLFFVISGFILCLLTLRDKTQIPGVRSSWSFLQRRIARIFPVYWIFAAPQILIHLHHGWAEILHYAPALFLLPGYAYPDLPLLANFSWTLIFEMFFYLVLAAVMLFTVRRAAVVLTAALVLSVGAGAVIGTHRPILMVTSNPMLLEFGFGALIAVLYFQKQNAGSRLLGPRTGWALLILGCAGAVVLEVFNPSWIAPYQYEILVGVGVFARSLTWGVVCALVLAGVVFISPRLDSRVGRASVALGNASYSTYLLSGMAFPFLARYCDRLGRSHPVNSPAGALVLQVAIVGALMLIGLIFYELIERPLVRRSYHMLARSNT